MNYQGEVWSHKKEQWLTPRGTDKNVRYMLIKNGVRINISRDKLREENVFKEILFNLDGVIFRCNVKVAAAVMAYLTMLESKENAKRWELTQKSLSTWEYSNIESSFCNLLRKDFTMSFSDERNEVFIHEN